MRMSEQRGQGSEELLTASWTYNPVGVGIPINLQIPLAVPFLIVVCRGIGTWATFSGLRRCRIAFRGD
jgi:hypothetical protein